MKNGKQEWHEINGSALPKYTWIPSNMVVGEPLSAFSLETDINIVGWYRDPKEPEELYQPLFSKVGKVGDQQ